MRSPAVHEQTPLLQESGLHAPKRTPLPKLQMAIIFLIQSCEPMASHSIFPYINQLITDLGVAGSDKRKVGYYAGLIESLFYVTQAATALQWGRISDRVGRKPVLLLGLAGSTLSVLCFGLSRTFLALIISRCLSGLLNGNIGVLKSAMSEITDYTNRNKAFAFIPIVWGFAVTIAPALGGLLSQPHERFPTLFSSPFWKDYPYFLPCLVVATFIFISFLLTLSLFDEPFSARNESSIVEVEVTSDKPLRLRELLTYPVIISIANYFCIAFSEISFAVLLPLLMSTPVEYGGFGCSPVVIGSILASVGAYLAIFQLLFSAELVCRFGARRIFIVGTFTTSTNNSVLLPLISAIIRWQGVNWIAWSLLGFALFVRVFASMSFGCICNYVNASAPSKNSLGTINGIAQTMISIARASGPALVTSLFAASLEKNLLGGYAVYVFLFSFSCLSLLVAVRLPQTVWEKKD